MITNSYAIELLHGKVKHAWYHYWAQSWKSQQKIMFAIGRFMLMNSETRVYQMIQKDKNKKSLSQRFASAVESGTIGESRLSPKTVHVPIYTTISFLWIEIGRDSPR